MITNVLVLLISVANGEPAQMGNCIKFLNEKGKVSGALDDNIGKYVDFGADGKARIINKDILSFNSNEEYEKFLKEKKGTAVLLDKSGRVTSFGYSHFEDSDHMVETFSLSYQTEGRTTTCRPDKDLVSHKFRGEDRRAFVRFSDTGCRQLTKVYTSGDSPLKKSQAVKFIPYVTNSPIQEPPPSSVPKGLEELSHAQQSLYLTGQKMFEECKKVPGFNPELRAETLEKVPPPKGSKRP